LSGGIMSGGGYYVRVPSARLWLIRLALLAVCDCVGLLLSALTLCVLVIYCRNTPTA